MLLSYSKTINLLEKYDFKPADHFFFESRAELSHGIRLLEPPYVLKIVSPDVLHKTDLGFVQTNLHSEQECERAYYSMLFKAKELKIRVRGFLLQHQYSGLELILGGKRDVQFGSVVLFGIGGIFTEIYKDFSLRIFPFSKEEALEMISEIKASKLLEGYRGLRKVDKDVLSSSLCQLGVLLEENKKIKEIDLNPCFIEKECIVADARIIV
ncbi:MAG: acetate--CoA ligase family protein [archaeon]